VGRFEDLFLQGRVVHAEMLRGRRSRRVELRRDPAIDLAPGQTYVVDTGHMVGWDEGVSYDVQKAGNWTSTMLGGEGLVVRLTGPGRCYIQTRSPSNFSDWIVPKLPSQRS
jgi:uncharacterized protein (AIM24 family)